MRRILLALALVGACIVAAVAAQAGRGASTAQATNTGPLSVRAPGGPLKLQSSWLTHQGEGWSGCVAAGVLHCYFPSDIRSAYGVDQLTQKGDGQTIVLVDSYGSPQAADELQIFHDTFFPDEPDPDFDQVFPLGNPPYQSGGGNGKSGPAGAAGWAVEAALDVQWAYAIAPHAHIVLLAVPPAETLGVQGFPNIFKAISDAIDAYPAGTVFSLSLGITEETFGGAAATQTAKFDQVFQKGNAKGDSFFAASGDYGRTGASKQQKDTRNYPFPTTGWPASSPYVTAVGGTQLQFGWTWDPKSDIWQTASGDFNPDYFNSTSGGDTNVVWNESWAQIATGGGPSSIYPRPSWQDSVAAVIGDNARGVPDLSWNAAVNGAVLVYLESFMAPADQGFYLVGGTSAASPQVAALTALVNEARAAASKAPIGDLAPRLYTLGAGALTDVVPVHQGDAGVISGNLDSNTLFQDNGPGNPVSVGPVPGAPALSGWDMTTGFGTPWAPTFVSALAAL